MILDLKKMTTSPEKPISCLFKVQFKDDSKISKLSVEELQAAFHFTFSTTLSFRTEEEKRKIIENCPYSIKYEWLLGSGSQLEESYREAFLRNDFVDTYVKWIDAATGYGLFADFDIPEHFFIGEYVGVVCVVDKKKPELNPYCFHYPTRFWSYHPCIIDAKCEGNLARFINHSLQPNLHPLWILEEGVLHLIFYAKKSIKAGEELTFNYGLRC